MVRSFLFKTSGLANGAYLLYKLWMHIKHCNVFDRQLEGFFLIQTRLSPQMADRAKTEYLPTCSDILFLTNNPILMSIMLRSFSSCWLVRICFTTLPLLACNSVLWICNKMSHKILDTMIILCMCWYCLLQFITANVAILTINDPSLIGTTWEFQNLLLVSLLAFIGLAFKLDLFFLQNWSVPPPFGKYLCCIVAIWILLFRSTHSMPIHQELQWWITYLVLL